MKKTIKDYELKGKTVIVRCDLNVPIKDGEIIDDTRIRASLETLTYALGQVAKVVVLSHLGRVKEEGDLEKNNLSPVAQRLSSLLGQKILFSHQTRGADLENTIQQMRGGELILVQNTRYEDLNGKKESKNDPELGAYWASLGDLFINDAFGTAHRAHASNVGIASHLENGIGFLMEKELHALEVFSSPEKPFVVILGGAKVKDKIGVIENLVTKADTLLIGGGMAFTFLKAAGYDIGKSLVDEENLSFCQTMLTQYPKKIKLPIDVHVASEITEESESHMTDVSAIQANEIGLDLGPKTIALYQDVLQTAKTVLWNGPLGVYEIKQYQTATKALLKTMTEIDSHTVLGGGDIVAAAVEFGYDKKVSHASTGGGATLEYLEGKELPGLQVILSEK